MFSLPPKIKSKYVNINTKQTNDLKEVTPCEENKAKSQSPRKPSKAIFHSLKFIFYSILIIK